MSESKVPDPDMTPANYVRFPGVGLVHVGVFIVGGGLLAWLAYRAWGSK